MAEILAVSVETIRGHVRGALSSLGARTLPEALQVIDQLRTGTLR